MVILGIDPGFSVTGFSIIKKDKSAVYLLDYGDLRLPAKKHLSIRTGLFYAFMQEKIKEFNITDLALETPFLGKNTQSFLKLGYLRGILYLLADQNSLMLHEFSPREVKQSVTGFGGASKDQVARIVLQLFPKIGPVKTNDVTDALAVTLCGLWRNKRLAYN